jgi:SPP1 gp7 family putative phage head morphogenesis protein
MSALDDAVRHFRQRAMEHERAAATALVDAYGLVWSDLQGQLDRLTADIAEAQANGETISRAFLNRQARYQALMAQTEEQIRRYAQFAERTVLAERRAAVDAAQSGALDLLQAALGPNRAGAVVTFNRLPVEAIDRLVGALSPDSPLRQLFDGWGPKASKAAGEALVSALAEGVGPRKAARALRQAVGEVSAVRALRISRNELNRTLRDSSLAMFRENADALVGYRWLCARSKRTCPLCWAMDGKLFPLDRPFATHIACRCTAVPVSRDIPGWKSPAQPKAAREAFTGLPERDQRVILGAGLFQLFRDGLLDWDDLAVATYSRTWGSGRRQATLREIRAMREADRAAD